MLLKLCSYICVYVTCQVYCTSYMFVLGTWCHQRALLAYSWFQHYRSQDVRLDTVYIALYVIYVLNKNLVDFNTSLLILNIDIYFRVRLVSLAAQKFISEIANDALQHCKTRGANQNTKTKGKDRRYTLTMEDLTPAVAEYGIIVKKPHYFVWIFEKFISAIECRFFFCKVLYWWHHYKATTFGCETLLSTIWIAYILKHEKFSEKN